MKALQTRRDAFGEFSELRSFRAALVLACSLLLIHLALTFIYRSDLPPRITLGDLILLAGDGLAAAALLDAAKRSTRQGTISGVAWLVLAVGQSGRAISDLIVAVSDLGLQRPGLPPPGAISPFSWSIPSLSSAYGS